MNAKLIVLALEEDATLAENLPALLRRAGPDQMAAAPIVADLVQALLRQDQRHAKLVSAIVKAAL